MVQPPQEAVEHLAAAKGHLLEGGSGGELFYSDNRAGIPGTLHRISAMRDRNGGINGLTYRVGRSVPGVGRLILDILHALSEGHDASGHEVQGAVSPSLLLLGAPGTGKTTLLRDVAHLLSDTFHFAARRLAGCRATYERPCHWRSSWLAPPESCCRTGSRWT
jgi:stage III sporulation protein SpoIIIAA